MIRGLKLRAVQVGQAGVAAEDIDKILTQWAKRIGEAHSRGGQLADIFKANNIALTDTEGRLRSSVELMRDYANLIAGAGSDQERMALATLAFGDAGEAMVLALRDGADGMDRLMKSTDAVGGVLEDKVLRRQSAYQNVIERLREEREMLGLDATEQRILSEQRRAGVSAASDQGKAIEVVVRQIEAEAERLGELEAQQREVTDAVKYLAGSALDGMLAWAQGAATAEDAARGLASEILRAVSYAALLGEGPLAGLFGGGASGGGGGSGGLVGLLLKGVTSVLGGGAAADPWAGFRADGGPVDPFKTYVVGEKGPELLRMGGRSGYVVPNSEISAPASSQRPVSITFNVTSPDAASFVKSRAQIETLMARAVARGQRGL